jgi:hypothetical protein
MIDSLPLWVLCLITIAPVLLATKPGWRLGDHSRHCPKHEDDEPIDFVVGSTLGLLAFLLAFTFEMAACALDARKQLVLLETNWIGTAYLRAGSMPAP